VPPRPVFHLIPHTHWDREWYLPRAAFEPRLVALLDDLIPMLEAHPDLRFTLDGQTILLEDYFAIRPDRLKRVARLVKNRQLAVGPWYVLADEIIPRPESLRKNLELGARDAEALGGAMRVLYSPDAFGHPDYLPGLATDFGLEWGVVWRGLAGDRVRGPDLYRWSGPDGRSIVIHHLPPGGYEVGADLPGAGPRLAEEWARLRAELVARSVTEHVAVPIGADHHAAHPELPLLRDRLAAIESAGELRWSRWEDYFAGALAAAPELATISGELRWSHGYCWSLQGVHSTRARMKRRHSDAESQLRRCEPLAAAALAKGGRDRSALLDAAWRRLIQCQFHDTIAGTVCDEAAREQEARLAAVAATGRDVVRGSLLDLAGLHPERPRPGPDARPTLLLESSALGGRRGSRVVKSEIPFFRRDVLVGPPDGRTPRSGSGLVPFALRRPDGRLIPVQVISVRRGLARTDSPCRYPDLDEVDLATVAFDPGPPNEPTAVALEVVPGRWLPLRVRHPVTVRASRIENDRVSVTIGRGGTLALVDKRTGERYAGLLGLEDEADRGDLYTPWIGRDRRVGGMTVLGVERAAAGPLVGCLAMRWTMRSAGRGTIAGRTEVAVHAGSPVVHCRIELDNQARDHRLVLRVPVWSGRALARPHPPRALARPSSESPVPTAPGHDVVRIGRGRRGLRVEVGGFFEYELRAGEIRLTVLRSVGRLSADRLPTRPGHAAWPVDTPDAQELGPHQLDIGLTPFSGRGGSEPETRAHGAAAVALLG
jgi:hypothetical protein